MRTKVPKPPPKWTRTRNAVNAVRRTISKAVTTIRGPTTPKPLPVSTVMTTTAAPPTPPDWEESCRSTIQSLNAFTRTPVQPTTKEYDVLAELVNSTSCLTVSRIERVVNPTLWKNFKNVRKELLSSKTMDLELLKALDLNPTELEQRKHTISNFAAPKGLPAYSDNVAMLYHCTRGNLETVLSQGLDERLGNGGLLGRGIYFADDPVKSSGYGANQVLIVCAVYLGDCLQSSMSSGINSREPEKSANQKRSPSDLFFDSIVGRPANSNEYVVFNRNHCVPIYLIHYTRKSILRGGSPSKTDYGKLYTTARSSLPPFHWTSSNTLKAPTLANRWPFFAQTIFKKMGVPDPEAPAAPIIDEQVIKSHLATLRDMGFQNDQLNTQKLRESDYSLDRTVEALCSSGSVSSPSTSRNGTPGASSGIPIVPQLNEDGECPICCIDTPTNQWSNLKCTHKLCTGCYTKILKCGRSMYGNILTYLKCPFCNNVTGTQFGTCPDGTMDTVTSSKSLPGFEKFGTLAITYEVQNSKHSLKLTGYLPNSPEGIRAEKLLRTAWDRRLIFSLGTNASNGEEDGLVWNIRHKTQVSGGVESNAYPDPNYLGQLLKDLEEYGIQ